MLLSYVACVCTWLPCHSNILFKWGFSFVWTRHYLSRSLKLNRRIKNTCERNYGKSTLWILKLSSHHDFFYPCDVFEPILRKRYYLLATINFLLRKASNYYSTGLNIYSISGIWFIFYNTWKFARNFD
jgi:hypothetical protein